MEDALNILRKQYDLYHQRQQWNDAPKALYLPVQYIMDLGGKRIRPILALIAYNMWKNVDEAALSVAYGIELFHNFSLVHDDIMDAAPLRRGQPTVHHRYGLNTGILSGDVMLIYVYRYLQHPSLPPERAQQLIQAFTRAAIQVCEGQQRDMNFEQASDVSLEAYLEMIAGKTAALLAAALEMGAISAGADSPHAQRLHAIGMEMGLAFQLQDDYLDVFGAEAKVGKQAGGDIIQNKKAAPFLLAWAHADQAQRKELQYWYEQTLSADKSAEKVAAVRKVMLDCKVPDLIAARIEQHTQRAAKAMEDLAHAGVNTRSLRELVEGLLNREF